MTTRPADHREPGVKKGVRTASSGLAMPVFTVVTGDGAAGSLDFVVPSPDVPLVVAWLDGTCAPDGPSPPGTR